MSRRPPDDVAQVVLRALLAWPALGLFAGLLVQVVQVCVNGWTYRPTALFGLGVGLGAALAVAVVEVGLAPLGRRWPRLRGVVELPLLALLAPVALLGGEFVRQLYKTGSSALATEAVLAAHEKAPLELLDLDCALSIGLVLSGLVVGRALGWRPAAQAALGLLAVLSGLCLRLAAGRLEHVWLVLALPLEGTLAALAPYVVVAADRAVRAGRRLLHDRDGGHGTRFVLLLLVVVSPVALAATVILTLEQDLPFVLHVFGSKGVTAALLGGGAGLAATRWPGSSNRTVAVALLAGAALGWLLAALEGWEHASLLTLVVAAGLVVSGRLAALQRAAPPRAWRRRAMVGLALGGLVLGEVVVLCGPCGGDVSGWERRAELGLWLGADPIPLLRWAEGWSERRDDSPWLEAFGWGGGSHHSLGQLRGLLVAAADEGDVSACLVLTDRGATPFNQLTPDQLRWLRLATAAGDLEAARRLLGARHPDWPNPPDVEAASAVLLAAAPGRTAALGLALLWRVSPAHRPQIEARATAEPARWLELVEGIVPRTRPDPLVGPGRPLLRAVAAHLHSLGAPSSSRWTTDPAQILQGVLELEPALAGPGDTSLWSDRLATHSWPDSLLAATDLGPLDPERSPALEAAARGDAAAVWSLAVQDDPLVLRARAHVLLAEARAPGHRVGALRLARTHLVAARANELEDAAGAFDQLLLELHTLLPGGDSTGIELQLQVVHALRDDRDDARVTARLEAVRAFARKFGPVRAGELPELRQAAADDLRRRAARPGIDPEAAARQRRAATRLEWTP